MRNFPRWPNLKHFNAVTTIHFTDGQSFYDILKCVLPSIAQLFPTNEPLIHCIRAYQRFRIMVGMTCMPERRLQRLDELIKDYERRCSSVANKYGKNFDFFKQHSVNHVVNDLRERGTTNHGSTRPGEGFQQEAREAYEQTNGKDVAPQMNHIDELQEAVARFGMEIDAHDLAWRGEPDEEVDETPVDPRSADHWTFGAPVAGGLVNSKALDDSEHGSRAYKDFDFRLRSFLAETFSEERIAYEDAIMVRRFKCAYIEYQSLEAWRGARDVIRCNSCFHNEPRYDSLLVNQTEPGLHIARARALLRCRLPSGRNVDIALVRMFGQSRWKPKTRWDGCEVREEQKEYSFLSMEYVIRGALMAPIRSVKQPNTYY
ncbi:hypothetical protein R3P38DRAFT_3321610 [Favolaschia claudopus]|uniref:Uncharacterized protein n=1 Tax=Favolaschia claudopus TaxID=2862362 RepID=A0AAW0ARV9_9AGAR